MLKLTGNVGKSIIVDAIQNYNNARVYSYDKELIPVMESYHVNSDEYSIKEFCEYILEDIDSLSSEQLPVNMVVIYTNLTDKHDITMVEDYANTLEFEGKVGTVVVTSKFQDWGDCMRYADYDNKILTEKDLDRCIILFEKDIEDKKKELEAFIDRATKKLEWVKECENNKNYCILGGTFKSGRKKEIMLIVRYPDGTQREERYSFDKISEMRDKLSELEDKYTGVDWSKFEHEI